MTKSKVNGINKKQKLLICLMTIFFIVLSVNYRNSLDTAWSKEKIKILRECYEKPLHDCYWGNFNGEFLEKRKIKVQIQTHLIYMVGYILTLGAISFLYPRLRTKEIDKKQ